MNQKNQKHSPEVIVFAGPNGSGKSIMCSDLEAAVMAEKMREEALAKRKDFIFETVLSTDRNMNLLKRAKENGYFIRCIYVLTKNPDINVVRVRIRTNDGGHDVPEDKVRARYWKALKNIPDIIDVCDIIHIYDNTDIPFRIFKKRKGDLFFWGNEFWSEEEIHKLTGK